MNTIARNFFWTRPFNALTNPPGWEPHPLNFIIQAAPEKVQKLVQGLNRLRTFQELGIPRDEEDQELAKIVQELYAKILKAKEFKHGEDKGFIPGEAGKEIEVEPRGEFPDGKRTNKFVDPGYVPDRFMAGKKIYMTSSNVAAGQYDRKKHECYIWFLDGSEYKYYDVQPHEAMHLIYAPSKGGAVWDLFRVLGSKTAHKKRYERLI